jgi:hypothetical protein
MRLLVVALALLALPAFAGELIRYRTPDGSIGFVDDEKRLPPGVEVISRTPLDPPRPPPAPAPEAPPTEDAASGALPGADAAVATTPAAVPAADPADCAALEDALERTRCRTTREDRCYHHGLPASCTPAEITAAQDWCARGEALREEIAGLEDELEVAQARHDECLRRGGMRPDCDTEERDEAERAATVAERRVQALEEQCLEEGCLPGWVREGCAFSSGSRS